MGRTFLEITRCLMTCDQPPLGAEGVLIDVTKSTAKLLESPK